MQFVSSKIESLPEVKISSLGQRFVNASFSHELRVVSLQDTHSESDELMPELKATTIESSSAVAFSSPRQAPTHVNQTMFAANQAHLSSAVAETHISIDFHRVARVQSASQRGQGLLTNIYRT